MHSAEQKTTSIENIITLLQQAQTPSQYVDLIDQWTVEFAELETYHYYGEASYGRNLIFSCDEFEVILMCWRAGEGSVAHDHNDSLCVMKCLLGELSEQRYLKQPNGLEPTQLQAMPAGSTCSITDAQGVHSIRNQTANSACSLHFYFPPIHQSNIYTEHSGDQQQVCSIFTSEYGVIKST